MSRLKKIYLNSSITLICNILQVFIGFIVRKIFITTIGVSFLGYNSVLINTMQILNLIDCGIGIAIASFLYKPLAVDDKFRVAALMYLYKKIYMLLGIVVLFIGIVISFYLEILIPDITCDKYYIKFIFYIHLLSTVLSYYLSYNRTLLFADQKTYSISIIDSIVFIVCSFLQILFLYLYQSYLIFVAIFVARNIISNILLSLISRNIYKLHACEIKNEYVLEYRPLLRKYVKDIFVSRIGATIFYNTDNIIISLIKGTIFVGYLANYCLIVGVINNLVYQIMNSIQSTFGNFLVLNNDVKKKKEVFSFYFCVSFIIGNVCSICVLCLIQAFIILFLGHDYLLPISTCILLSINLLLYILLIIPSQVFQILNLFNIDKWIIICSVVINVILSVVLVHYIGINGCLIGTTVASLIYLFFRLCIIAKIVFNEHFISYVMFIIKLFFVSFFTFILIYNISIETQDYNVLFFIVKLFLVFVESCLSSLFAISFLKEFAFIKNFPKYSWIYNKRLNFFILVCLFLVNVIAQYLS